MKHVLVIEREYGTGAGTIARRLAEQLGWKLYDQALTEEIAKHANASVQACQAREERVDPWLYRLAKVFWRGSHERSIPLPDEDIVDADRLVCLTEEVIVRIANEGNCVIVGRGAPHYLRNRDDTFCVFLYAPREYRYQRVLAEIQDEAQALELVDNVDEERRTFIKRYFGVDWPVRHLYHAMLNTSVGEDISVENVLFLMKSFAGREKAGRP